MTRCDRTQDVSYFEAPWRLWSNATQEQDLTIAIFVVHLTWQSIMGWWNCHLEEFQNLHLEQELSH